MTPRVAARSPRTTASLVMSGAAGGMGQKLAPLVRPILAYADSPSGAGPMPMLSLVRRPTYLVPLALSLLPQPSALHLEHRPDARIGFSIPSRGPGNGARLGGLEGSDRHCTMLAADVG